MLADRDAVATIAVKDLKAAKKFYGDTLGLKLTPVPEPEVLNYKSGNSTMLVYKSQFAGSNKATSVAKGVAFEHYDFPGMIRKGDVHIAGKSKAAWFKDPDGNILAVVSG